MTERFEQAFNNYENELNTYQDRFDRYKELLNQYKDEPAELARQLGAELAAPFISHITESGLGKMFGGLSGQQPAARSEGTAGLDDLVSNIPTSVGELPFPDAPTGALVDADTLKNNILGKLNELGKTDLAEDVGSGIEGATGRAFAALRSAGGDALDLAKQMLTARTAGLSTPTDVVGEAVQRGTSQLSDLASGLAGDELTARGTLLGTRSIEPSNVFGLRGTEDLDPESLAFSEPPPSQATTNIIGRLFGRAAPEAEAPVEDLATQLGGRLSGLTTNLSEQAQSLFASMGRQVSAVQEATGATQAVAEEALATGATGIRGGTELVSGLAEAGETAAVPLAGVAETAEAVGAAAAPETFGISELITGAIALGSLLGGVLGRHEGEAPVRPIPMNLPRPTFQAGLSTSE